MKEKVYGFKQDKRVNQNSKLKTKKNDCYYNKDNFQHIEILQQGIVYVKRNGVSVARNSGINLSDLMYFLKQKKESHLLQMY